MDIEEIFRKIQAFLICDRQMSHEKKHFYVIFTCLDAVFNSDHESHLIFSLRPRL